jgi:hypothetical protein
VSGLCEAIATIERLLWQQEGEWKAAIGAFHQKASQEEREVSGLKEVLRNLDGKHEKLREPVARQDNELADTRQRNSGLGCRVQQLEEENRPHRDSSEGLKGELALLEAGHSSEGARLQQAIAARGSKVKEDFPNVQGELAKMKEEVRRLKMISVKQFLPSVRKGKLRLVEWLDRVREVEIDVPDGNIGHLMRECDGNVHDRHVVEVACGSFERETFGVNPHFPAKNAADLEISSCFQSASRSTENVPLTRNNCLCCDFKERRIVPPHCAIRTDLGYAHLKSWLAETSADGEDWREVSREEDNAQLNDTSFAGAFPVAGGGECRDIRLVNIGRNHNGNDSIFISVWEMFRSLIV